jgi:mannose-6-phosphate isomerase-like protein (cupin superfamily)
MHLRTKSERKNRAMPIIIDAKAWLNDKVQFSGEWQGKTHGSNICVIANYIEAAGGGPRLHQHPYVETFIIREGTGVFLIGSTEVEASAGQILVVPANTPHKFKNRGPGPFSSMDIHENCNFSTEWLEDF